MASFDLGFPPSRYKSERPGYNGTDLQTFFATFPDDHACLAYLFRLRFNANPICPRCGKQGRWQRHQWQKHYFHPCGGICSPMKGTVFARTQVPLQLWFYAMLCFTNSAEGIVSPYLARLIGVSEPTAFHMAQRIRTQMALIDRHLRVGGAGQRVLVRIEKILRVSNQTTNSPNSAFLLIAADDEKAIITVIQKPRRTRLIRLLDNICHKESNIFTDCLFTNQSMSAYGHKRPLANFEPESFSDRSNQARLAHGLMQYINLSFHDQFKGVSLENFWLFIKEYQFKYNRRTRSSETFWDLVSDFPLFDEAEIDLLRQNNSLID